MGHTGRGLMMLEIIAQTNTNAGRTVIAEVAQTHLVINSWFNGEVVIEKERIAHLRWNVKIGASFGMMRQFGTSSKEEAVLRNVVAKTCTNKEIVNGFRMLIACIGVDHPAVGNIIACIQLKPEAETIGLTIRET